eukprot:m.119260 g.119260  ORF g.119260 m.119260 type:complete len:266 (+) comp13676_c0_seq1:166-963(+)
MASKTARHTDEAVVQVFTQQYGTDPAADPYTRLFSLLSRHDPTLQEDGRGKVLYPGSFVHIVPSLTFRDVTYLDAWPGRKNAVVRFFDAPEAVTKALLGAREYDAQPKLSFILGDYCNASALMGKPKEPPFDVLVSLSASLGPSGGAAGCISRACASLVRPRGWLVVNDDHGDASVAMGSPDLWQLEGVYEQDDDGAAQLLTDATALDKHFIPSSCSTQKKAGEKAAKSYTRPSNEQLISNAGYAYSKRPVKFDRKALAFLFKRV